MPESLCISIPKELECYQKQSSSDEDIDNITSYDSNIETVRNSSGEIDYIAYYTDLGDLVKKVYYKGSSLVTIENYRNNKLYTSEEYENGNLISKDVYTKVGKKRYDYIYNRQNKIIKIQKHYGGKIYKIEYGYDELNRVNARKIYLNASLVKEQKYRYDILDRIVEYRDEKQRLCVHKIGTKNELISYTITDRIGNEISIINHFSDNKYRKSEVTLNGHTTVVKNENYVDNVMLKKPYTTDDDLDLILSNLFSNNYYSTKRETRDVSENVIEGNIQARILPISMRKRILYNMAVNT